MSTLPPSISSLSVLEKCELLDALWEDLETHGASLSNEQTQELDRRTAAYEQDPSAVVPWEHVKARLLKQ